MGANATILPGVTVGRGAVVTAHVPPMTVVAGVPARIIRQITPGETTAYRPPRSL